MDSPTIIPTPHFLSIPCKQTDDSDWSKQLHAFIIEMEADPQKFTSEIATLNKFRNDLRGAVGNFAGRDIAFRYFSQLEFLSARFSLEALNQIEFSWSEAFTPSISTKQSSIAFEKANVLFNLAAIQSQIGVGTTLTEPNGHKTASQAFQASSSLFKWISENFLHPPLVDIQRSSLLFFSTCMLAQAQECIALKAMHDNKSHAILAKLTAGICELYTEAAAKLTEDASKSLLKMLGSNWPSEIKVKAKFFLSLAEYFRAELAISLENHGEAIARLNYAEATSQEAKQLADEVALTCLRGNITKLQTIISTRKDAALKENSLIYHQPVPSYDSIATIERLILAKSLAFTEAVSEIKAVVTPTDLFSSLIPIKVHEEISMYSEEKAKLLRYISLKVAESDKEFQSLLTSLGFPEALDNLGQSSILLPPEITVCRNEIGNTDDLQALHNQCVNLDQSIKKIFKEIDLLLEKDNAAFEKFRDQIQDFDQQRLLFQEHSTYYQRLGELERRFATSLSPDMHNLCDRFKAIKSDLNLLKGPESDIVRLFPKKENLLVDDSFSEDVGKVKTLSTTLENLRKERNSALGQLRIQIMQDDITAKLVSHKKKDIDGIFKAELAKYDGLCERIEENVKCHNQTVTAFREAWSLAQAKYKSRRQISEEPKYIDKFMIVTSENRTLVQRTRNLERELNTFLETAILLLSEVEAYVGGKEAERAIAERSHTDLQGLQSHQSLLNKLKYIKGTSTNSEQEEKISTLNNTSLRRKMSDDDINLALQQRLKQLSLAKTNNDPLSATKPKPVEMTADQMNHVDDLLEPSLLD